MYAFSGTILGPEHDAGLPTVAQIDGETLILASQEGRVGEWLLDQVQIIEVGNGYFEVVAADRRLSLVVDQPEAFERALEAERARRAAPGEIFVTPEVSRVGRRKRPRQHPPEMGQFGRTLSFSRRPRHGKASVRTGPFILAVAGIMTLGYLGGSYMGDLLNGVTTEVPTVAQTPPTEVVVRDFEGSGDGITSPFGMQAHWEIRWSFEAPEDARLEVIAFTEGGAGVPVAVQARPGSGVVSLTESGIYRLEIKSPVEGEWTFSVIQLANADVR